MPKKRNPYLSPHDILTLLSSSSSPTSTQAAPTQPYTHSISTALNNTLIADLIFSWLSTKDIAACLFVSSSWSALAQPYLWRTFGHYYLTQREYVYDPEHEAPYEWWQPRDGRYRDRFGRRRNTSYRGKHSSDGAETGSRSAMISWRQKGLIVRNAFRVRELKIDYSASNLLDVPFTNLTRFCLNCRYSHTLDCNLIEPDAEEDRCFREAALMLIAQNPRLQEIELSYVEYLDIVSEEGLPGTPPPETPFALRALLALQQPSSKNNSSRRRSCLYSLKLVRHGNPSLSDICSIIENCPPSLKELTILNHLQFNTPTATPDPETIRQRFATIKDSCSHNHSDDDDISTRRQQKTPALRLLKVVWYWANISSEMRLQELETAFFPMLSCFPDLQHLYLPELQNSFLIDQSYNSLAQFSQFSTTLFSYLLTNCPNLTNINFGNNLFEESVLYDFLKSIRLETLREVVLKIGYDFLDRIIPMLLERSSAAIEVLCLQHNASFRAGYIGHILASCPRLTTLVVKVKSSWGWRDWQTHVKLQDLLGGGEWVCLELDTLSIGVLTLSDYDAMQGEEDIKDDLLHYHHYRYQEHSATRTTTHNHDDPELAVYIRKIHGVAELYRRLKLLPNLKTLDLFWDPSSSQMVPYDLGLMYSNNTLTIDNLYWLSLMWSTIYGSVQETIQRFSEREKDVFFEENMQAMGINARDLRDSMKVKAYWRRRYYCCGGGVDEELEIPQDGWGPQDEEGLLEDLHDAYKSRNRKRRENTNKRKK